MCHCQPHTAPGFGQPVLIKGNQYEVIPFSPLWLHIRSAFSLRERFLIFTLLHLSFVQHSLSRLRPTEAGRLPGRARYSMRPVVLPGRCDYLASMVRPLQNLVRTAGRKGPPFLYSAPFFLGQVMNNTSGDCFGSSGHYIGQENSRPRFGITVMHRCCSHVVRSDFCCLLSVDVGDNHSKGLRNWIWTWLSP